MNKIKDKLACKECGVILNKPKESHSYQFYCPRCDGIIYKFGQDYKTIILMAITSILLFIPSIMLPLISLEILGLKQTTTLIETVFIFFDNGYVGVSVFITFIGIIIPFALLVLILLILIPLKNKAKPEKISIFFKLYEYFYEWQMAEVYLISIFVSIVKLYKMATLEVGVGLYFFCAFLFFMIVTTLLFNPYDVWKNDEI